MSILLGLLPGCIGVLAQPQRGSVVIGGEFGGSIVWDGFALQEKEISEGIDFGLSVIDSVGQVMESGGLAYYHWDFGPAADIAVYVHPHIAIGAGYCYGWVDQFVNVHHTLKDNPGGRRLCSTHQFRGQLFYSINLKNYDVIDIVGVPFYTFGTLTRIPLALKIYGDDLNADDLAVLRGMHEPVAFKGYGAEIRIRGRHFLNKYLFAHGSFYGRIEKTRTEDDPFEGDVTTAPQGSCGVTLGLGLMLGGNSEKPENTEYKNPAFE